MNNYIFSLIKPWNTQDKLKKANKSGKRSFIDFQALVDTNLELIVIQHTV